ncbi:MAG: 2'-5' RNA ligase family protein [Bacteroidetes bacterium]|nr:2'-5' RNA ligase family protein [Bacteroidota bacterium]
MALQKYFIALIPPEAISERIKSIKQDIANRFGSKGALRSPAHITLHMPFEYEDSKEAKLISTLDQFRFETPFDIRLHHIDAFEPRVVFIHVDASDALMAMQKQLVQYLKMRLHLYNQAESMRGFHPHVTVAFRDLKKAAFYEIMNAYRSMEFTETFRCSSLYLLKQNAGQWIPYHESVFIPKP